MSVSPGRRRVAIALMAIGAAVAIPGGIAAAVSAKDSLKVEAAVSVPAHFQVALPSGDWEIYEQTGTYSGASSGFFSFSSSSYRPPDIGIGDLEVQDSLGTVLSLTSRYGGSSVETYETGSRIYTGVASFHVARSGRYSIVVDGSSPDKVIVARPPLASLTRSLPALLVAVIGTAPFVVGLVLLILDIDRRRRIKHPFGPATSSAPWGAGPAGPAPWSGHPGVQPDVAPPSWPPRSPPG